VGEADKQRGSRYTKSLGNGIQLGELIHVEMGSDEHLLGTHGFGFGLGDGRGFSHILDLALGFLTGGAV